MFFIIIIIIIIIYIYIYPFPLPPPSSPPHPLCPLSTDPSSSVAHLTLMRSEELQFKSCRCAPPHQESNLGLQLNSRRCSANWAIELLTLFGAGWKLGMERLCKACNVSKVALCFSHGLFSNSLQTAPCCGWRDALQQALELLILGPMHYWSMIRAREDHPHGMHHMVCPKAYPETKPGHSPRPTLELQILAPWTGQWSGPGRTIPHGMQQMLCSNACPNPKQSYRSGLTLGICFTSPI